jgi:hypothetical protein
MRKRESRDFELTPLRRRAVTADRLAKPVLVVEVGKIGAEVGAAAFCPELCTARDQFRHLQHVLDLDGGLDLKGRSGMQGKQPLARVTQVRKTLIEPLTPTMTLSINPKAVARASRIGVLLTPKVWASCFSCRKMPGRRRPARSSILRRS